MRELRLVEAPQTIEIDVLSNSNGDPQFTSGAAERLLGALVSQARLDGMSGIEIHVDPTADQLTLSYFKAGRSGSSPSWEMTPPPVGSFPSLLQCAMGLANLDSALPIRGSICARIGRKKDRIRFELSDADRFILRWDPFKPEEES